MPLIFALFFFLFCFAGLELYSIGFIAKRIGLFDTLVIVISTGIVGAFIARKNAKIALRNLVSGDFSTGAPGRQVFDAVAFFIAAALLIIPGIITDVAGILLLFPFVRSALYKHFSDRKFSDSTGSGFNSARGGDTTEQRNTLGADEVIDIDAEDVS
jgi:UPF0716 protein FxsA